MFPAGASRGPNGKRRGWPGVPLSVELKGGEAYASLSVALAARAAGTAETQDCSGGVKPSPGRVPPSPRLKLL
jgi:hypothetical protein